MYKHWENSNSKVEERIKKLKESNAVDFYGSILSISNNNSC